MARPIPKNSSNDAVSNNADVFGTRAALKLLPVGTDDLHRADRLAPDHCGQPNAWLHRADGIFVQVQL